MSIPPKAPDVLDGTEFYLRTELLERIAHELRGPAGVTLGALDEMERLIESLDTSEESRSLMLMARRGAKRVLRTAERLTRTAHLESGPAAFSVVPQDVRELVACAAREAEQLEGRSAIRVVLELGDEPRVAQVDTGWLMSALEEVFAYAIRSARSNVQIAVRSEAGRVEIIAIDDRMTNVEVLSARFLSLRDKRDCALGWPLAWDVAKAHGGELSLTVVTNDAGRNVGARAVLSLSSSDNTV